MQIEQMIIGLDISLLELILKFLLGMGKQVFIVQVNFMLRELLTRVLVI